MLKEKVEEINAKGVGTAIDVVCDVRDYAQVCAAREKAVAAFGIRVITAVLTDEIAESIRHLHADRVVVTTKEDIAEVLKEELENEHPVDVAIDCLGGEIMGKCIHYLKHGARWIMIAALAGTKKVRMLARSF